MKTLFALSTLAVLGLFAATPAPVSAQVAVRPVSPEDIAERCTAKVNNVVDRCRDAASTETERCLRVIRKLLATGHRKAARRVARDCIQSATDRTGQCVDRVWRICDACIDKLLALGAFKLARRVHGVCEDAVEDLRAILQREKSAIRGAFGG